MWALRAKRHGDIFTTALIATPPGPNQLLGVQITVADTLVDSVTDTLGKVGFRQLHPRHLLEPATRESRRLQQHVFFFRGSTLSAVFYGRYNSSWVIAPPLRDVQGC